MFSIECKSNKKATKGDIHCELIATTITSHDTSCLIVSDITSITSRRNEIRWRYEPQQCSRKKNSTGKGPVKTHFTRSRRPGYILAKTMYWCHWVHLSLDNGWCGVLRPAWSARVHGINAYLHVVSELFELLYYVTFTVMELIINFLRSKFFSRLFLAKIYIPPFFSLKAAEMENNRHVKRMWE